MALRHTDFMQQVGKSLDEYLQPPYKDFRFGERRWHCQVYFGRERRIHYEVSRPWSKGGRRLEIGLHLESHNRALNERLLLGFDRHLVEVQAALENDVKAEVWDKGWTKVYEIYPDEELTAALAIQTAQRLAQFIAVLQPIYESLLREKTK